MSANCLTDGYTSKLRNQVTVWGDLRCMATMVSGWRSEEMADGVEYDIENAPGYVNVDPDEELEFKAIATFAGPMGCDFVVVGWQDYEATTDTNPATGSAWEDGDEMYMGHYETESLAKGWLKERLHSMAFHISGEVVYATTYVSWNPETQQYEDGEKSWYHGDLNDDSDMDQRCMKMATALLEAKKIHPVLMSVAKAYVDNHHTDEPEFQCDEAYAALIDLWSTSVLQREFDPGGDSFQIMLQAQPDTVRDKVIEAHRETAAKFNPNVRLVEIKMED